MADFRNKLSNLLSSQVPDYVLEDHPLFLDFVKAYYQLLESAEIKLTNIGDPDHIQLNSQTGQINFISLNGTNVSSDDEDDRLLLEDTTYGDFINGEIITGSTSGATTTILIEDVDVGARLFVAHQNKFIEGELITGSTSNAQATILKYRANPVQNIQQLLDYADVDKTIQGFLSQFRNSFLTSIPDRLDENVDKRKLIKNIKSLYQSKGTKRASEIFFKLLFNEVAEIRHPKDNVLRLSDGKWDTRLILRCLEVGTSDASNLIGQTITQADSPTNLAINEATGIVEDVFKFIIGGTTVTELVLGNTSVVGTFISDQNITGIDNTDSDVTIKCTLTGIISDRTMTTDGALYNEDDEITLAAGGTGSSLKVGPVGSGAIQEVIIDDGGTGYVVGDVVNFSTGNATAKVSVVNGGVTLESGTGTGQLVMENETGKGDPYSGDKVVQESGSGNEDITDVRMIDHGNAYISLPTLTVTSGSGSGAKLLAYGSEIGRALLVNVIESGYNYQASPAPTLTFPTYALLKDISGTYVIGETVSGLGSDGSTVVTAKVVSLDTDTQILKLSGASGIYGTDVRLTGAAGATGTIVRLEQAEGTVSVSPLVTTDGSYINEDGWISENTMKTQDSLLYQDYSYIIKVGRSINEWRDSYIKTLHPAGFYFQGEIAIASQLDLQIRTITGLNSGTEGILRSALTKIYSQIIGRRLGTEDDGTSLRANAKATVSADFDQDTVTQFSKTTRDVTLTRPAIDINYVSRVRRNITDSSGNVVNVRQAFVYAGPRLGVLDKWANTVFGITANTSGAQGSSGITFAVLNGIKVQGTRTILDGSNAIFLLTSNEAGRKMKTNFTIPSEIKRIIFGANSFDEDATTFDSDSVTMDVV